MAYVGERDTHTRESIVSHLRETIAKGVPIIGAGSSVGIVAKFAERGGADLIICYSTGKSRIMGLPTTPLGDSNRATLEMYDEIANVVDHTPIISGIQAGDPTSRRLAALVDKFRDKGFDGLINFPSIGPRPDYAAAREHVGQGLNQEYEMVRYARENEFFTMGYAYNVPQGKGLAAAGVDVLVPHAGWTTGGVQGADTAKGARSLEAAAEHVQTIIDAAKTEIPDIICLCHGGSIAEAEDTKYLYEHTDSVGFVGASSIERIPIERAIEQTLRELKAVPLPK
jgi:predicted TIM-barrel enzyme